MQRVLAHGWARSQDRDQHQATENKASERPAFAGANAHLVDKIVSVKELINFLVVEFELFKPGEAPKADNNKC